MEYPIYENGREIGRLQARREGLYTVFEARLPKQEGLTRLYLCGEGECRLLGVMEPGAEESRLCRRLSRREQPTVIVYASTSPEETEAKTYEVGSDDGWTPMGAGTLYHTKAGLLAFPAVLKHNAERARRLVIRGKEYIVFHW